VSFDSFDFGRVYYAHPDSEIHYSFGLYLHKSCFSLAISGALRAPYTFMFSLRGA
jgi:hypothetical protein